MKYSAAIDLGGTNIGIGIVSEEGELVFKTSVPVEDNKNHVALLTQMAEGTKQCIEECGIAKEDIIFVGSQKDVNLWQYRMDGTMVSKISLSDFASEIAGLCYDPVGDWLWISDSNREELYLATVDGKLLATYSLEGIKNAESVCVDRERGCIWLLLVEHGAREVLHGLAIVVKIKEGIVLFGSTSSQRLKPVGVVRSPLLHCPFLHADSHTIGYITTQSLLIVHQVKKFFYYIAGYVFFHLLTGKYILREKNTTTLC